MFVSKYLHKRKSLTEMKEAGMAIDRGFAS